MKQSKQSGRWLRLALASALILAGHPARGGDGPSVLEYHNGPDRSGRYVVPGLTWERARNIRRVEAFRGEVEGDIYAQPLYWQRSGEGAGLLIVATEENVVDALDAGSGATVWRRSLGSPVPSSSLSCGNINPLGITGTPAIDPRRRAVYLDAFVDGAGGPRHLVFGLSLEDGSVLPGWPVDVAEALGKLGLRFNSPDQNQRGALTIAGDRLYLPYGGHFGDCGEYHGWVIGVSLHEPKDVAAWETRAVGGGIWAPGGIAYDGRSLFVATGNTMGAKSWADGEAVIRLGLDLARSTAARDFFAPRDWRALDGEDGDLGGTAPLPLEAPGGEGPAALVLALGKDGKAYLLNREHLGGIGGALAVRGVSEGPIRTAPAAYRLRQDILVALQGRGTGCPSQGADAGLLALRIRAEPRPAIETAWCGSLDGEGSPMVTTADAGGADPIVWILGAEGDDRLHGYRGDTGEELTRATGAAMEGLRHFATITAAAGRLYVAGDGRIYAFGF